MLYELGERRPEFVGEGQWIAPSAAVIGSVRLRANANVWFNAVLRGDNDWIEIGENTNIQDASILHTDPGLELVVGDGVTVGHRAMLHGCRIGGNSLIGIGAIVLNGASIGENCVVGAASLITEGKSFPDGTLVMGAPAKAVRELEPDEIERLKWSAAHYVENAGRFRDALRAQNG